jgi:hypothetical protein
MSVRVLYSVFGVSTSGAMRLWLNPMNDILPIGTTAHLGVKDSINFTPRSVEYTILPEEVDGKLIVPNATQKLVVVRINLQYPEEARIDLRPSDVHVTASDLAGKKYDGQLQLYSQSGKPVTSAVLRSGQQVDAICVMLIPSSSIIKQLDVFALDRRLTATYSGDGIQPLPFAMRDAVSGNKYNPFTVRDATFGQVVCIGSATVALKRRVANLLAKPTSAGIEIKVSNPNRTALEISPASFNVMVGKGSQQRECMLEWVGKSAGAESIVLAPMRSVTGKVIVPDQKPDPGAYISVTDTTTRRGLRIML